MKCSGLSPPPPPPTFPWNLWIQWVKFDSLNKSACSPTSQVYPNWHWMVMLCDWIPRSKAMLCLFERLLTPGAMGRLCLWGGGGAGRGQNSEQWRRQLHSPTIKTSKVWSVSPPSYLKPACWQSQLGAEVWNIELFGFGSASEFLPCSLPVFSLCLK